MGIIIMKSAFIGFISSLFGGMLLLLIIDNTDSISVAFIVTVFVVLVMTLIFLLGGPLWKKFLRDQIKDIESDKDHLARMKKSSDEMNRSGFIAFFIILSLISFANLIPLIFKVIPPYLNYFGINISVDILSQIEPILLLYVWVVALALGISFIRTYINLKRFKEANEKFDKKHALLKSKLEGK